AVAAFGCDVDDQPPPAALAAPRLADGDVDREVHSNKGFPGPPGAPDEDESVARNDGGDEPQGFPNLHLAGPYRPELPDAAAAGDDVEDLLAAAGRWCLARMRRGHALLEIARAIAMPVISTGPYRVVRHPMYA